MKRFLRWLMMFGLLAVVGCNDSSDGEPEEVIDFGDNDPNLIVCQGDSITEGGSGELGPPYPDRLAAMSGKATVNEGDGGERSGEGADRVDGVLAKYKPGYLVIFYGANDAIFNISADSVIDNIRYMITAAQNNKTVPIVCTVLPTYGSRGFANGRTQEYSQRIRVLCRETGARLADVRAEFGDDESLFLDGLHPTDAGLDIIAMTVNEQL